MENLVSQFTKQLSEAIEIGSKSSFKATDKDIQNVIITGLGGSGIGGKIISDILLNEVTVPVFINNEYSLPNFANENTLVIASSYSGNTEETLSAVNDAIKRNCEVSCITSGGKILEIAKENNFNYIVIPGGNPPRAMLCYSLVQQFYVFHNYGLISRNKIDELKSVTALLDNYIDDIKTSAKEIAGVIVDKTPIIYAETSLTGIATRLRQQINENAKTLCWHHTYPELNHNELVGWASGNDSLAVICLRTPFDFERNQSRMDISKEIIKKYTPHYFEIHSKGKNLIEASFYLILLGDWTSVYLAQLKNVDPIEIEVINFLKSSLAKQ